MQLFSWIFYGRSDRKNATVRERRDRERESNTHEKRPNEANGQTEGECDGEDEGDVKVMNRVRDR